jgi:hypothetical protein
MAQIVTIKLKSAGPRLGPFSIEDNFGNNISSNVSREDLKEGVSYTVVDEATVITICSIGSVKKCKNFSISEFNVYEYADVKFTTDSVSCVWTHLKNPLIYNTFYGNTEPYVIEYPFSYKYKDEILRNIKDYTKAYKYVSTGNSVIADYSKFELNDSWFNKAILYNGQQCSGVLKLVPKPKNNLSSYMSYPILGTEEKSIMYTKSDNFYQYNTFWSITKDSQELQFIKNCESLSIDKTINQDNMDYSKRSHKKDTLRAKELKVRHILDNRNDVKLVSQFIIAPAQNSEK